MSELIARFASLASYGLGALLVLLLYALESELRFGSRARSHRTGASDRYSTLAVSLSAGISVLGFALAMKSESAGLGAWLPRWFRSAAAPGLPVTAWVGVVLGAIGCGVRLWAVLTLRARYTRTLLVEAEHSIERRGPYERVRHPGYLGSLLCLNGIALASGNWMTFLASIAATSVAYGYRIKIEDEMLVRALGRPYADYRREVGALLPRIRSSHV